MKVSNELLNRASVWFTLGLLVGGIGSGLVVHELDREQTELQRANQTQQTTTLSDSQIANLMPDPLRKYSVSFYSGRYFLSQESIGEPTYICASPDLQVVNGIAEVLACKIEDPKELSEGTWYPIGGGVQAAKQNSFLIAYCNGKQWQLCDCADSEWAAKVLWALYQHALEPAPSA